MTTPNQPGGMARPVMLWHSGYYDGPLSGVARYRGEMVWFNCVRDPLNGGQRTYALHRLTREQRREVCRRHALWRKMVGKHCDYGRRYAPFSPPHGYLEAGSEFWRFYAMARSWPDLGLTNGSVVRRLFGKTFIRERRTP